MNDKHLEKIKQQYEEREIIPSSSVWESLEQKLSQENNIPVIGHRKRGGWLKYAAVLVLLGGSAIIWLMNDGNEEKIIRKQNPVMVQNPVKAVVIEEANKPISISKVQESQPEFSTNVKKTAPVSLLKNTRIKTETTPQPATDMVQNSEPQHIAVVPNEEVISENTEKKYIMASDLLFSRKMDKTRNMDNENDRRMGVRENSIKPDFISILGKRIPQETEK